MDDRSTTLLITNWNGSYSGGGTEQLYIGNDNNGLTSGELAQVKFAIANSIQPARLLSTGEVVPVSADIATTVSGPLTVNVASNLTCTINVANVGPSLASNVVVSDSLPVGSTFVSASGGGIYTNGVVSWLVSNFNNGATTNFTVTVTAPLAGSMTNTVSSTATTIDTNLSNNNGSATNAQAVSTVAVNAGLANSNCAQVANNTTLTWSQTVNSGNNGILLVGISLQNRNSVVSSVTYGGIALTNIVYSRQNCPVEIWGLAAPPVGTANIVVNWSNPSDMNGWSAVFTNVNQSSPIRTTGTASGGNSPSVTVNASTGDLVVDTMSTTGDSLSAQAGSGKTQICNESLGTAGNATAWAVQATRLEPVARRCLGP